MDNLFQSINSALADARGDHDNAPRWKVYTAEQIKQVRRKTELSQRQFASCYGLNINSLKSWESGRSTPEQPSCLLLALIDHEATTMLALVSRVEGVQQCERLQPAFEPA